MLQHLARRFRKWLRRPELPIGDVAGEDWAQVGRGPLPPARPMGLDGPAMIPLSVPVPPPLPPQARRAPVQSATVVQKRHQAPNEERHDDPDWQDLIARAKRGHTPSGAVPARSAAAETSDWSAVIAAAKRRNPGHA